MLTYLLSLAILARYKKYKASKAGTAKRSQAHGQKAADQKAP